MIGETVWIFDENNRVYKKDENGKSYGGPIWREHWRPLEIVGETRVSWLTKYGHKVPKKGGYKYCFSEQEINERSYVIANKYKISEIILKLDYGQLKRVAELIGYEP